MPIIKLGVATPTAHRFALYFALLSAITPPVALVLGTQWLQRSRELQVNRT